VSKPFYLGSIVIGNLAAVAFSIAAGVMTAQSGGSVWDAAGGKWMLLAYALLIYVAVVDLMLLWKAWKSIQEYGARTSPGQAIGLFFLPVFNLYWLFQALWGFSKDYNANVETYELDIPKLPEGLFLAYSIVLLIAALTFWVPLVNMLLGLGSFVLWILVASKTVDAVNRIRRAPPPEHKGLIF